MKKTKKRKKAPITERISSDLLACKKVFDQLEIPWVIMGGIVLGYARYKEIMPWDTDLDIGVFVEIDNKQWRDICNLLIDSGFRYITLEKISMKNDFLFSKRKSLFNMWLFHKKGNFYEAFPNSTKGFKFIEKAEWFDEIQIVDFLGTKYPMPNNIEDFLDYHYGKEWKINIIKNHGEYLSKKRGKPDDINDWLFNRKNDNGNLWWPALLKIDEDIGDFDCEI